MRAIEFISEGRKPVWTPALRDKRIAAEHRYQLEQIAKMPLFAHMYAVDSPHDIYLKAIERMTAKLELDKLKAEHKQAKAEADKAAFDPIHKMAARQRKRDIGA